jgi:hypothetical protein
VRDEAASAFEATRGELFIDPWVARNDSINLILDGGKSRDEFLRQHAPGPLSPEQQQRALLFLKLQENALLMYTSCGWFFTDLAGIEPVQIMKYVSRAIDLMAQLGLPSVRRQFLEVLSEAKSNRPGLGNGADIYRRMVETCNPSFKKAEESLADVIA